jgi:hypothetical protein
MDTTLDIGSVLVRWDDTARSRLQDDEDDPGKAVLC